MAGRVGEDPELVATTGQARAAEFDYQGVDDVRRGAAAGVVGRLIATLGRHSMGYIMKKFDLDLEMEPISKIHGKAFDAQASYGPVTIVTLYHPASALYNGGMRGTHKQDFEVLKKYK